MLVSLIFTLKKKIYIYIYILLIFIQYAKFINYYLYLLFVLVLSKCFMFINKNLRETVFNYMLKVFNYCTQWSGVENQEIDCSIISMGAMSHIA